MHSSPVLAARHHQPGLRVDDLDLDVRVHPADRGDPPLHVVVGAGLGRHRRRLGHPVADRDLGHVHLADHPLHHLDRARRAGHDAGPQRGQVVVGEVGQRELGDEHRRHAVQRGAPLRLHRAQRGGRVEPGAGMTMQAPCVVQARLPEHHAEAVVERHRDADPVLPGVAAALADEEAVVEDVVVRQRRALGEAGRPAGVLDVDRVVEGALGRPRGQRVAPLARPCAGRRPAVPLGVPR